YSGSNPCSATSDQLIRSVATKTLPPTSLGPGSPKPHDLTTLWGSSAARDRTPNPASANCSSVNTSQGRNWLAKMPGSVGVVDSADEVAAAGAGEGTVTVAGVLLPGEQPVSRATAARRIGPVRCMGKPPEFRGL